MLCDYSRLVSTFKAPQEYIVFDIALAFHSQTQKYILWSGAVAGFTHTSSQQQPQIQHGSVISSIARTV